MGNSSSRRRDNDGGLFLGDSNSNNNRKRNREHDPFKGLSKVPPLEGPPLADANTKCKPTLILSFSSSKENWVASLDHTLRNDLAFSYSSKFFKELPPEVRLHTLQYLNGQELLSLNKQFGGAVLCSIPKIYKKEKSKAATKSIVPGETTIGGYKSEEARMEGEAKMEGEGEATQGTWKMAAPKKKKKDGEGEVVNWETTLAPLVKVVSSDKYNSDGFQALVMNGQQMIDEFDNDSDRRRKCLASDRVDLVQNISKICQDHMPKKIANFVLLDGRYRDLKYFGKEEDDDDDSTFNLSSRGSIDLPWSYVYDYSRRSKTKFGVSAVWSPIFGKDFFAVNAKGHAKLHTENLVSSENFEDEVFLQPAENEKKGSPVVCKLTEISGKPIALSYVGYIQDYPSDRKALPYFGYGAMIHRLCYATQFQERATERSKTEMQSKREEYKQSLSTLQAQLAFCKSETARGVNLGKQQMMLEEMIKSYKSVVNNALGSSGDAAAADSDGKNDVDDNAALESSDDDSDSDVSVEEWRMAPFRLIREPPPLPLVRRPPAQVRPRAIVDHAALDTNNVDRAALDNNNVDHAALDNSNDMDRAVAAIVDSDDDDTNEIAAANVNAPWRMAPDRLRPRRRRDAPDRPIRRVRRRLR